MAFRTAALIPLLLAPGALASQQGDRDSGRLIVRRGDSVIGEEEFTLEVVRDPEGGRSVSLVVAATYPPDGSRRAAATFGTRRITVRISGGGTEVAREYPRTGRDIVLHDGLLGLLAIAGQIEPGAVTVFAPPAPGRRTGSLEALGVEAVIPGGPVARHLALRENGATVELWFDENHRLLRVAVPSRDVVAERAPPP
jgi:hypothetical protein